MNASELVGESPWVKGVEGPPALFRRLLKRSMTLRVVQILGKERLRESFYAKHSLLDLAV
jgi:hypothetical protein